MDFVWSGQQPDPTGGATHFFSPSDQKALGRNPPDWATGQPLAAIGHHQFYAPNGAVTPQAPDYLGSLAKTASQLAPAPQPAPQDDPLAALAKSVTPPASPPTRVPQAAPTAQAPADETLPQYIARVAGEAHGHGQRTVSDLVTGAAPDSWGDLGVQLAAGAGRGLGDIGDTLAEGIARAGTAGAAGLRNLGVISPQTEQSVKDWRSSVLAGINQGNQAFNASAGDGGAAQIGRVGGQIAGSAPFLGAAGSALAVPLNAVTRASPALAQIMAQPGALGRLAQIVMPSAAVGAGASALTSAASDQPLSQQMQTGALTGAVLGPVGAGVSKLRSALFSGGVDAETAALAQAARQKYSIDVGAGQISANPMVRFFDSVMRRMPFTGVGPSAINQQMSLNRAIANEMGVAADKVTPATIKQATGSAYASYDAAKAAMGPLNTDAKFYGDLHDVYTNAHYNLEPSLASNIDNHLRNVVGMIDTTTRTLDPDLYQSLTRQGGPLDKAINSRDSKISTYAGDIKNALEGLVGRNDPALKALKDDADYKYFVAKSIEPLAAESPTGDISPAKLLRAADYSPTDIGELGRIGRRFMTEFPSSGTAERTLIMQHLPQLAAGALGVGGAGALGAASYFDPDSWQRNALVAAGTVGLGRVAGAGLRSSALANLMIRRGLAGPRASGAQKVLNFGLPAAGALLDRPRR